MTLKDIEYGEILVRDYERLRDIAKADFDHQGKRDDYSMSDARLRLWMRNNAPELLRLAKESLEKEL